MNALSTREVKQAWTSARFAATSRFYNEATEPIHFMLALLEVGGNANLILKHLGFDLRALQSEIAARCREMPYGGFALGLLPLSSKLRGFYDRSLERWRRRGTKTFATEDLLLAILEFSDGAIEDLPAARGLTCSLIEDHLWLADASSNADADGVLSESKGNALAPLMPTDEWTEQRLAE